MRKGVIRQFRQVYARQLLQGKNGLRTLHGKLCHVVGSIFQFSTFGIVRNTPVPVFFYIRSIHYQQIFLRLIMINQQVIYNTAFFVGKTSILHLAWSQGSHIIGSHFLKKSQRIGAFHPEFSHVGNVEYTHSITNGEVFINDTGIFYRHIISRKLMHLSTQRDMFFCKRSGFHFLCIKF